tara:strand:+ start:1657 stop:1890 length:234 start_codon:yes stop_codon:yes gene_type:complete
MIEDAGGWVKYSDLLKNEYEKEKVELSIEKKIKCDDGGIRIYEENMRGVISDSDSDLSFLIYQASAKVNLITKVVNY